MAIAPAPTATDLNLEERFPGAVAKDTRKNYTGYIVAADKLIEVATAARDQLGYTYLSSATAVDYLEEGKLEMVYHLYNLGGGPALMLKAQAPRDDAVLPSLVSVFPGADLQEREAWDLFGIRFTGHPNLKRILMWEGFEGHPMRKDWKEAYYEEDGKPFEARWPGGEFYRAEQNNPFGHNVKYPGGFTVEGWTPEGDKALYAGMGAITEAGSAMKTDHIVVNLGPQHPSTHGVFRVVLTSTARRS